VSTTPSVSGKDTIRALTKLGFRIDRIEGSHHMIVKDGHPFTIPIPIHGSRPLPKGTLASIIRMAKVTKRQFFEALG